MILRPKLKKKTNLSNIAGILTNEWLVEWLMNGFRMTHRLYLHKFRVSREKVMCNLTSYFLKRVRK